MFLDVLKTVTTIFVTSLIEIWKLWLLGFEISIRECPHKVLMKRRILWWKNVGNSQIPVSYYSVRFWFILMEHFSFRRTVCLTIVFLNMPYRTRGPYKKLYFATWKNNSIFSKVCFHTDGERRKTRSGGVLFCCFEIA